MKKPSLSLGPSKSITACCSKVGIKKGPWTPEEDEVLANYVRSEGEGRWRTLPKRAGLLRCGKSCRLRWMNYLRPSVKRGHIAPDEEDLILRLHRLLGNRWSLIAGRIPGRTDNDIKNYWNTHLSKKLISQGIDPRNHKPLKLIGHGSSMANHDHVPKPDTNPPSPNSSESTEKNTVTQDFMATNLEYHDDQQYQIQQVVDNSMADWHNSEGQRQSSSSHGNEGDYIENCSDDILITSFLDSLINDNYMFVNQQQPLQPTPPPPNIVAASADRNLSHGANIWEVNEIMSSSSMAAFGNQQTSSNNHHQQYHP